MFLVFEKAVGTRQGYGEIGFTTACLKLLQTTPESKLQAEIRQGWKKEPLPNITTKVDQQLIPQKNQRKHLLGMTELEGDLFL